MNADFLKQFEGETMSTPGDYQKGYGTGTFAMAYARWLEGKLAQTQRLLGQEVEKTAEAEIAGEEAREAVNRLAGEIMNLYDGPSETTKNMVGFDLISYKLGRRDVRHRAAEMLLALLSSPSLPAASNLKKDFANLLENYWYMIRTKECTLLPGEQEKNEKYAQDLMKKWKIIP